MPSLDIFNDDAFDLQSMTKSINDLPHQPGRIGQLGWFSEEGISTTAISIEKQGTALSLVPSAARGAPGTPKTGDKRTMVSFDAIHLPQRATVMADEVQNVRAFGSESELETVQNVVNKRLAKMRRDLDTTIEYQRIGAMKGQVLDADGTTVLHDMFSTFGVSQNTHDMVLDNSATKVRIKAIEAKRLVETDLAGLTYRSLRVMCSSQFFDALISHADVEVAYARWLDGAALRDDPRAGFNFAGILWEEYRGAVGAIDFIEDNCAYMVPEGVPDLFITNYAPANYGETVNTIGLPYYAKQKPLEFNKGIDIESQSNPISICTRPRSIIKLSI